jgi:hypothetical protein
MRPLPGDAPTAVLLAQGKPVLGLFIATTFLSAFLLFAVQPLFAKMVLPVLGGSSSVWAVALCFFQAALLAGYVYAHLVTRYVARGSTGIVHVAFVLAAMLTLPIGVPAGWSDPPRGEPYLWQLGLFAIAVGPAFVAVAANAPLLQVWFARTGHPHARDPYFLYAASNLGALTALLSYPFVLEPAFGLTALSRYWSVLYVVLAAALAACFALVRVAGSTARPNVKQEPVHPIDATLANRLGWCWLALVPAALLTAVTTHIATDIASAPLLWVIPLALYLATFVLAFQDRLPIPMWLVLPAQLAAVLFALLELAQSKYDKWTLTSGAAVAVFFLSALVAHRTLYLTRPRTRDLTEFYLWMSLGGVLGGLLSALIAPKTFADVLEYPLLIALALACRPGVFVGRNWGWRELYWIIGIAAVGLPLVLRGDIWANQLGLSFGAWGFTAALTLAFAVAAIAFWGHGARQLAVVLLMSATIVNLSPSLTRGVAVRSYYGIYRVMQSLDGQFNVLSHGTTLHGAQRIRGVDGHLVVDTTPGTYYYPDSPMAHAVKFVQAHLYDEGRTGRFGVVGVGTGSLACYAQKGEAWRFFEIDPVVIDIAVKSTYFTFLANCMHGSDIIIGDARLKLAREPDKSFDVLIIDAFSSDAVPVHLMTAEALKLYASKLKDDGVLVLHISNRYLDLNSVLGATLPLVPELKGLIVSDKDADGSYAENSSIAAVFAKGQEPLLAFRALKGAQDFHDAGLRPWTDDASDLLGPFLSQWHRSP